MAISLEAFSDRNKTKACLFGVNEIDTHRSYGLIVSKKKIRKVARLELVLVLLVVGVARQQSVENRIAADGMIGTPILR